MSDVPEKCRLCENYVRYLTEGKERHMCSKGKPMKPDCLWFLLALHKRGTT